MPAQIANSASNAAPAPLPMRMTAWVRGMWRQAGTIVAVALALLMTWHVIYGKDGLSVWQQKRAEDRSLQQQIQQLQQENAHLRQHVLNRRQHRQRQPDRRQRDMDRLVE